MLRELAIRILVEPLNQEHEVQLVDSVGVAVLAEKLRQIPPVDWVEHFVEAACALTIKLQLLELPLSHSQEGS